DRRKPRGLAGDEREVEEGLAEGRLGREEDHHLVHVRREGLLVPLVRAVEEVPARAEALDGALRSAREPHLDEVAARRVLLLALARADDLPAVGELDQELAPEIRDDPPLDDDLLLALTPGRHADRRKGPQINADKRGWILVAGIICVYLRLSADHFLLKFRRAHRASRRR